MDSVDILLVEDNPGDVALVERAFEDRELPGTLHSVKTGEAALDWLYRRGEYANAPRPDVILLDLNLPATNGHAILDEVKSTERLQRIPVVVLTSSRSPDDLNDAYGERANAYLIKPADPIAFADRIESFAKFWAATVTLPDADRQHDGRD